MRQIISVSQAEFVEQAAAHIVAAIRESLGRQDRCVLALCGGGTVQEPWRLLARASLDWSRCWFWMGDERCVPADNRLSNLALARRLWLDPAGVPPDHIIPLYREGSPAEATALAAAQIETFFGQPLPRFDLCLNGIGPDGHTASLFAGQIRHAAGPAVAWTHAGLEPWVDRLTLTPAAFNQSHAVLFMATGAAKVSMIQSSLSAPEPPPLPFLQIDPPEGTTTFLLGTDE